MKKIKMVCFDMDGTIADLYKVPNWLEELRAEDSSPYKKAEPMWDMEELATVLHQLQVIGIQISIITWLAKESSKQYDRDVYTAKKEWLKKQGFPYDEFHGIKYGTTKANCVRKKLAEDELAILIDDNAKVRKGWTLGDTINPTEDDIIKMLKALL